MARFFVGVAQGLNVVHKAMADPAVLQDMVRVAMQVWDAPTGCRPTIAHVRSANDCGTQDTGASPPHARIDHKVAGSREAIEAAQATLRDVPPYSP